MDGLIAHVVVVVEEIVAPRTIVVSGGSGAPFSSFSRFSVHSVPGAELGPWIWRGESVRRGFPFSLLGLDDGAWAGVEAMSRCFLLAVPTDEVGAVSYEMVGNRTSQAKLGALLEEGDEIALDDGIKVVEQVLGVARYKL